MDRESQLKRNQFAESIRQEQRNRMRNQMRVHLQEIWAKQEMGNQFQSSQFKQLKQKCRLTNFAKAEVESALDYLFSKKLTDIFRHENVMKFFQQISDKYANKQITGVWQANAIANIKLHLSNFIMLEIKHTNRDTGRPQNGGELADLHFLKYCFDGLLTLLANYREYFDLWQPISVIKNEQFSQIAFKRMIVIFEEQLGNLGSEQITFLLNVLSNFQQANPNKFIPDFLGILDNILAQYILCDEDAITAVEILCSILSGKNIQQIISIIIEDTKIYQNVVDYIVKDNGNNSSLHLVEKVGYFVGKMFCGSEGLCEKIYHNNMMIVKYLRSWLPIPVKKLSLQEIEHQQFGQVVGGNSQNGKIMYRCVKGIVYALSNIVGTSINFVQIFLSPEIDIYLSMIYLYKKSPERCRQEISYCLYNMVYLADAIVLKIMLDQKLLEVISQMLRETNSDILIKGMSMIGIIFHELQSQPCSNASEWRFQLKNIHDKLQKLGCKSLLESHIYSKNQEVNEGASKILQVFASYSEN